MVMSIDDQAPSNDEVEEAVETIATTLSTVWLIHGNRPSQQLSDFLKDLERQEIHEYHWIQIARRIDIPDLATYIIQRVQPIRREDSP
jgi:hypothetical protein